MRDAILTVPSPVWRDGSPSEGTRAIAEETAIALAYNGSAHSLMMGAPQDLIEFAIGVSLSEGTIQTPDHIDPLDGVHLDDGNCPTTTSS